MRDRRRSRELHSLAGIRELQRLRAEAAALDASVSLAARKDALSSGEELQNGALSCWTEAVTASEILPDIAALWSAELRVCDAAVRRLASEAELAGQELARRTTSLNAATLRRDIAGETARRAKKHEIRKEDDAAAQDIVDRHHARRRKK
ncbi:MAG: hypothetical protein JO261_10140 [Alphaproteobacteria bacterium]|nr:hypothetical protein [Alphaproteobacteria bacterium]MBV9694048.1 hypothetical protein [Alphaproteobacteria bacterium]